MEHGTLGLLGLSPSLLGGGTPRQSMPQEDDCACNVTNDVTSVGLDTKENQAHKDCAENEIVANNVTPMKKIIGKTKTPTTVQKMKM